MLLTIKIDPNSIDAETRSVLQVIYDKTIKHLTDQGSRSSNARGKCVFRGENGTKCAAGLWIKDEDYKAGMENADLNDVADIFTIYNIKTFSNAIEVSTAALYLINELADLHDGRNTKQGFYNKATSIANNYKLSTSALSYFNNKFQKDVWE